MTSLREGLLSGLSIVAAGPLRASVGSHLEQLGARLVEFEHGLGEEDALAWTAKRDPLYAAVYDVAPAFADGGREGLLSAVEHTWPAIRAVVAGALIPAGAGGKIVVIAPPADARPHARAAQAAIENMVRTLSTEWARHAITITAIAPRGEAAEHDIATLIAFLLSPAGDYFSGCRFELDKAPRSPSRAPP